MAKAFMLSREDSWEGPKVSVHRKYSAIWEQNGNVLYLSMHTIIEGEKFFKQRKTVFPIHTNGVVHLGELLLDFARSKEEIEKGKCKLPHLSIEDVFDEIPNLSLAQ